MRHFQSLRIAGRLTVLLALLLLLTAIVAGGGLWGQRQLRDLADHGIERHLKLAGHAAEIRSLVLLERRFEKDSFINLADAGARDGYVKKWQDARQRLEAEIRAAGAVADEEEDRKALADMARDLAAYAQGFDATVAAIRDGKLTDTQAANADIGRVKAAVRGMESAADALAERASARAATVMPEIDTLANRVAGFLVGLTLAGAVLAVLLGRWIAHGITRPLGSAVAVAEAVAVGRLDIQVPQGGGDEAGQLLSALEAMRASLVRIVGEVRGVSDSIATGSSQIAQGNADLSQRTEEQAANLQQTAASMEQLSATVDHGAQTARQAAALADEAERAAVAGGEVTGHVVQTMGQISESSRRIAEIIGTIDGIAFQTNILALNAAVEAARAGEQGRGFAVVAGEVRALAGRAAEAAREVRTLIARSTEGVAAGAQQVEAAGRSMQDIVGQVRQVAALVREMSQSTAEQSTGIGQVGEAVTQLDQVTQQNAALVEESAAAAESLRRQAQRLTETVARFSL